MEKGELSDDSFKYANQFSEADCIVIAAPYWDCGFPGILKIYIEAISVLGIVSMYEGDGQPTGLCKAEKLYYVTTRGGYVGDEKDLGFATIKSLGYFFGIKNIMCIGADGFDIVTNDFDAILQKAIEELPAKLKRNVN